jgi:hypothetical protein
MAQPLPLNERLTLAANLTVRTKIFFDTWWLFNNIEERASIGDVWNEYEEFLRFDQHAHFVAFCVHVCGLFDEDPRANSLPNLFDEVFPSSWPSAVEDEMKSVRHTLRGVVILRNNLFAHRSRSVSYAKVFELAHVKPDDLRVLCETALSVANAMLRSRGLPTEMFAELPLEYARKMLAELGGATGGVVSLP